jgi:hypothetical protein
MSIQSKSKAIADIILNQLGGFKFIAMTGARDFLSLGEGGLKFSFPNGRFYTKDNGNMMVIRLNAGDLYDIEYGRVWGAKYTKIVEEKDIFCNELQNVFTRLTGLDTHL